MGSRRGGGEEKREDTGIAGSKLAKMISERDEMRKSNEKGEEKRCTHTRQLWRVEKSVDEEGEFLLFAATRSLTHTLVFPLFHFKLKSAGAGERTQTDSELS